MLFIRIDTMRREHREQLYIPLGEGTLRGVASNRPQSHTQHPGQALPVEETVLFWPVELLQDSSYQKTTLHHFSRQGKGCSPKNKRQGHAGGLVSGAQQGLPVLSTTRMAEGGDFRG